MPNEVEPRPENTCEISVKGVWVEVPALHFEGKTIVVTGRWLKMASVHDEIWLETELEHPEDCVRKLKTLGCSRLKADLFTFTQKPPATLPKYQYHMEWDSVAVVPTSSFKDWWEQLPQETRKNVRRAQKRGVDIRVKDFDDELVKEIVGVNDDCAIRQGTRNLHYRKTFEQVKRDESSFADRSDFICAYVGSELIGFLKVVYRGEIASILNLFPKASHADKRPANALVSKAVELCEAKGISYLTYGKFNYGNKGASPLREFKMRNGFAEMLVPRFYVPLTTWGALSLRMNLHRGLLGILPRNAIRMGVVARTKWHHLKSSLVKPV
jgi:hypothetical protein